MWNNANVLKKIPQIVELKPPTNFLAGKLSMRMRGNDTHKPHILRMGDPAPRVWSMMKPASLTDVLRTIFRAIPTEQLRIGSIII